MRPPLIGITTSQEPRGGGSVYVGRASYANAVQRAGGLPVLVPLGLPEDALQSLLDALDGLVLSGGGDVDPELFDGAPHARVYGVDAERDRVELALCRMVVQRSYPFAAICRGFQVLNVAQGGTLYTHIPDQLPGALDHEHHENQPYDDPIHEVTLEPGSRLAGIVGTTRLAVNSLHHQGASRIGQGLIPAAYAADGLLEAIELPGNPFGIAVQWHPEWMPDSQPMRNYFEAFINAVNASRKG